MNILFDRVQGSAIEVRGNSAILTRACLVTEISGPFGLAPEEYLIETLADDGMPQVGDEHPADTTALCIGHRVEAVSGTACRVLIFYETHNLLNFGGESELIIEDDLTVISEQTTIHPKTRAPIKAKWVSTNGKQRIKERLTPVPYLLPVRKMTVRGHTIGRPPSWVYTIAPSTNSVDWSGMGPAMWLFAGIRTVTANRGRSFGVTLTFFGRTERDWSEYGIIQADDGQYIVPTPEVMTTLKNRAYAMDVYEGGGALGVNKVGLYEPQNFPSLFPFGV